MSGRAKSHAGDENGIETAENAAWDETILLSVPTVSPIPCRTDSILTRLLVSSQDQFGPRHGGD